MVERLRVKPKPKPKYRIRDQYPPNAIRPGKPGNPGKPKGNNNTPKIVKEMIFEAASLCGEDGQGLGGAIGYLKFLARTHPHLFVRLLERTMPLQLTGANDQPLQIEHTTKYTYEEAAAYLKDRNIPVPSLR